ncbi:uncharacterized protein LOC108738949 [Agrilus planipennis]|uniref:Uncharacterized protein LOC108738949 n=1 Tax=Agrilus planipennis TaxID=224129 RepID=A0A1W4X5H7_AGRPL|nr:uncharacterized protein LOC108738949 [Agrilus planipennis]
METEYLLMYIMTFLTAVVVFCVMFFISTESNKLRRELVERGRLIRLSGYPLSSRRASEIAAYVQQHITRSPLGQEPPPRYEPPPCYEQAEGGGGNSTTPSSGNKY